MYESVEESAIRLLREAAEPVVPLAWLQRELSDRGGHATHADQLEARLRQRADAVLVLGPGLPSTAATWPTDARETMERVLAGTGYEPGPHVVLLGANSDPTAGDPLDGGDRDDLDATFRASIATLCRCLADVPAVHLDLLQAAMDLREVRRRIACAQPDPLRFPVASAGQRSSRDTGGDASGASGADPPRPNP